MHLSIQVNKKARSPSATAIKIIFLDKSYMQCENVTAILGVKIAIPRFYHLGYFRAT